VLNFELSRKSTLIRDVQRSSARSAEAVNFDFVWWNEL